MTTVELNQVFGLAKQLSAFDKVRLIELLAPQIRNDLAHPTPRRSLLGLCADLGPAPSAEVIDVACREAWGQFPREDIE